MPNSFYDYEADNDVKDLLRDIKKSRKRKGGFFPFLTVIAALIIIVLAVTGTVFAFTSYFSGRSPSTDPPDTENAGLSAPTDRSDPTESTEASGASEASEASPTEGSAPPATDPEGGSVLRDIVDSSKYVVSNRDDPTYFDNAVMIGDSISYGLELYVTSKRAAGEECLGGAKFLTSGSLSYGNLLWDVSDYSVHPTYNGVKMKIEESLPLINPDKIYILLGSNDVAVFGVDASIDHAKTILSNIQNACPKATIIVLSTTPKLKEAEERDNSLNNADINEFNEKMRESCAEWGYTWFDIASEFKLEDGTLDPEYCGDRDSMGIHFLGTAYDKWIAYLESHKLYPVSAE